MTMPSNAYRLWQVTSAQAISTDLLAAVFDEYHVELSGRYDAFAITPAAWLAADDLQGLLEGDGLAKTVLVRGPLFDGCRHIELLEQICQMTRQLSQSLYPEKLVMSYESVAHYIDPAYNAHLLSSFIDEQALMQTFLTYCDFDLNLTRAAQALFIHRNTLIYRLDKIGALTGFDTNSMLESASLYFTLRQIKAFLSKGEV